METVRDIRCQRAIDLVRQKQTRDGKWLLGSRHAGKTYFEMEKPGSPSRWNTLRALRVLDWWEGREDRLAKGMPEIKLADLLP